MSEVAEETVDAPKSEEDEVATNVDEAIPAAENLDSATDTPKETDSPEEIECPPVQEDLQEQLQEQPPTNEEPVEEQCETTPATDAVEVEVQSEQPETETVAEENVQDVQSLETDETSSPVEVAESTEQVEEAPEVVEETTAPVEEVATDAADTSPEAVAEEEPQATESVEEVEAPSALAPVTTEIDATSATTIMQQITGYVDPDTPLQQSSVDQAWTDIAHGDTATAAEMQDICVRTTAEWTQSLPDTKVIEETPVVETESQPVAEDDQPPEETCEAQTEDATEIQTDTDAETVQTQEHVPAETEESPAETTVETPVEESTAEVQEDMQEIVEEVIDNIQEDVLEVSEKENEPESTVEDSAVEENWDDVDMNKEDLEKIWNNFDSAGVGYVEGKQLADILRLCGRHVSQYEVDLMLAQVDKNGDGQVTFSELLEFLRNRKRESYERMRQAFHRFDKNGDGKIDLSELRVTLTTMGEKLTEEEVNAVLVGMDVDGDGCVDFEEFVSSMLS